jgi:hypothetical protein
MLFGIPLECSSREVSSFLLEHNLKHLKKEYKLKEDM